VGMPLSPRIRDLGRITLFRTGSKADAASLSPRRPVAHKPGQTFPCRRARGRRI
jgi:hypothetical protein